MKIVIIEDDSLMYRMYKRILEHEKYQVLVADSAEKGIALVNSELPDAILLDIMMPNMNGLDVLKQLKNSPNTKQIPVIMLTNLGVDNVINEAFQNGASGYLVKSQTANFELLHQLKSVLETKSI